MKPVRMLALVAVAAAVLGACGLRDDATRPEPTLSPTDPSPSPTVSVAVGAFTSGTAEVEFSGSEEGRVELDLISQSTVVSEDTVFLFYSNVEERAVLQVGETPGGVIVGFATATVSVVSGAPDCTLEFDERTEARVTGTFSCPDLRNQLGEQGPIEVSGSFEASA